MTRKTNSPNQTDNKGGRPKRIPAAKFTKLVETYLEEQKANKKAITLTGFCVFANISKETLRRYEESATYVDAVKKLRLHAENTLINKLLNENKPVGSIFLLKSAFGYVEQSKIDITSNGDTLGVIALPARK